MIPIEAFKKLLQFVQSPSITNFSEALRCFAEIAEWLKNVWGSFEQSNVSFSSGPIDSVDLLTAFVAGEEENAFRAGPVGAIPPWLIPVVLDLVKKLLEKLIKKD